MKQFIDGGECQLAMNLLAPGKLNIMVLFLRVIITLTLSLDDVIEMTSFQKSHLDINNLISLGRLFKAELAPTLG